MQFISVGHGQFPGGYLLTIGVGNGIALQGTMLTSNQASQIKYGVNVNVIMVSTNESLTQNNENKNQKKSKAQK
jgi:hypothetical protein